jgi:hypothetical protein
MNLLRIFSSYKHLSKILGFIMAFLSFTCLFFILILSSNLLLEKGIRIWEINLLKKLFSKPTPLVVIALVTISNILL